MRGPINNQGLPTTNQNQGLNHEQILEEIFKTQSVHLFAKRFFEFYHLSYKLET